YISELPGNHGIYIYVDPPQQKQCEVKRAGPPVSVMRLNIRLEREGSHHRHKVQEQQRVPTENIGYFVPEDDFNIGPNELVSEPARKPHCHESPEESGTSAMAEDVRNTRQNCRKQEQTLYDVTDCNQAKAAAGQQRCREPVRS